MIISIMIRYYNKYKYNTTQYTTIHYNTLQYTTLYTTLHTTLHTTPHYTPHHTYLVGLGGALNSFRVSFKISSISAALVSTFFRFDDGRFASSTTNIPLESNWLIDLRGLGIIVIPVIIWNISIIMIKMISIKYNTTEYTTLHYTLQYTTLTSNSMKYNFSTFSSDITCTTSIVSCFIAFCCCCC